MYRGSLGSLESLPLANSSLIMVARFTYIHASTVPSSLLADDVFPPVKYAGNDALVTTNSSTNFVYRHPRAKGFLPERVHFWWGYTTVTVVDWVTCHHGTYLRTSSVCVWCVVPWRFYNLFENIFEHGTFSESNVVRFENKLVRNSNLYIYSDGWIRLNSFRRLWEIRLELCIQCYDFNLRLLFLS